MTFPRKTNRIISIYRKETIFVVIWSCWVVVYLIILILLIFLSYYSLVEHFTTRLAIHLSTFLLILTGAFIMQNIIRLVI